MLRMVADHLTRLEAGKRLGHDRPAGCFLHTPFIRGIVKLILGPFRESFEPRKLFLALSKQFIYQNGELYRALFFFKP